jgi:hypothetical protein
VWWSTPGAKTCPTCRTCITSLQSGVVFTVKVDEVMGTRPNAVHQPRFAPRV